MIDFKSILKDEYEILEEFETAQAYFFKIKQNEKFELIKVLKNNVSLRNIKIFIKLKTLNSKNLISIENVVSNNLFSYIILEYFNSTTLRFLLEDKKQSLSFININNLLWQVANGIDTLHNNLICHLDFMGSNILVDKNLKLKINDYDFIKEIKTKEDRLIDIHSFITMIYRIIVFPEDWNAIKHLNLTYNTKNLDYSSCLNFLNSLELKEK